MKKSLGLWQFAGFTAVCVGGTLLHFLYDWTGGSALVAPFSAVNESTWEHMKLFFFPSLVFAIVQGFFFREDYADFWQTKLIGTCTGLAMIPVIFYTYNGAIGKSPDWINIAIFAISAGIAYFVEYKIFARNSRCNCGVLCRLAIPVFALLTLLFFVFTYYPPSIPLFAPPVAI